MEEFKGYSRNDLIREIIKTRRTVRKRDKKIKKLMPFVNHRAVTSDMLSKWSQSMVNQIQVNEQEIDSLKEENSRLRRKIMGLPTKRRVEQLNERVAELKKDLVVYKSYVNDNPYEKVGG